MIPTSRYENVLFFSCLSGCRSQLRSQRWFYIIVPRSLSLASSSQFSPLYLSACAPVSHSSLLFAAWSVEAVHLQGAQSTNHAVIQDINDNNLTNGRWCRGSRSKSAVTPHATPVPHPFLVKITFTLFWWEHFLPFLVRTTFLPFSSENIFHPFWREHLLFHPLSFSFPWSLSFSLSHYLW